MTQEVDEKYMRMAFGLAKKGRGCVSPNPLVGAVLVKNNRVIGRGYHKWFGQAHAEINAFNDCCEKISGATLYVNLEPCASGGKKTPPCTPRIIQEGIHRVVISNIDKNPRENGRGIRILQQAGIKVVTNVLKDEGAELNKFFFKYIQTGLPYVTVKIARTLNGYITERKNQQTWISGIRSLRYVHRLRAEYDAVLVGANTVRIDNPQLTVRRIRGRNPQRIILDGLLSLHPQFRVFSTEEKGVCRIFIADTAKSDLQSFEQKGIVIHRIKPVYDSHISIEDVLREIGHAGITSLLVEGGSDVFSQFLTGAHFDEVKMFITPQIWAKGLPFIHADNEQIIDNLVLSGIEKLENDVLLTYKPRLFHEDLNF